MSSEYMTIQRLDEKIRQSVAPCKFSMGAGLYLWIGRKGSKSFKLRTNVKGKEWKKLGEYPEMGIDDAVNAAKKWKSSIATKKLSNDDAKMYKAIGQTLRKKSPDKTVFKHFRNMNDAVPFFKKLFSWNPADTLTREVCDLLKLQALVPALIGELHLAKKNQFKPSKPILSYYETISDFGKVELNISVLSWIKEKVGNRQKELAGSIEIIHTIMPLSYMASFFITQRISKNDSDTLFPQLSKLSKDEVKLKIAEELQNLFPDFLIDTGDFKKLFKQEVRKYAIYNDQFIEDAIRSCGFNGEYKRYFSEESILLYGFQIATVWENSLLSSLNLYTHKRQELILNFLTHRINPPEDNDILGHLMRNAQPND